MSAVGSGVWFGFLFSGQNTTTANGKADIADKPLGLEDTTNNTAPTTKPKRANKSVVHLLFCAIAITPKTIEPAEMRAAASAT